MLSINEVSGFQVIDSHRNSEGCVSFDSVKVLRVRELRRWHVGRSCDNTHWCRVTRSRLNLLTVCDRLVDSKTEIDEVIR